jgi:hypothetical protein
MKNVSMITALLVLSLSGCQYNSKQSNKNDEINQDSLMQHADEHTNNASPVSLNNGLRWEANAETTTGINNMLQRINTFPINPSVADYHALKVNLETEFNLILKECTMTGESHEQLHNYLMPMVALFNNLNSENIEICKDSFNILKAHLAEYDNYFQ